MAKVSIRKDFAEEISKRVNEKTESLLNTISTLGKKVTEAKTVYNSDNSSGLSIDDMNETINKIISSYRELNDKFRNALQESIKNYSETDKVAPSLLGSILGIDPSTNKEESSKKTSEVDKFIDSFLPDSVKEVIETNKAEPLKKPSKNKKSILPNIKKEAIDDSVVTAVTSVPLTSGLRIRYRNLDIANTAEAAINGKYKNDFPLTGKFFEKSLGKKGNYTFEYHNDGSVKVKKGERTIGYTTQENADYFIQNYHDTELGRNGNNEKLMEAFKAGSESIPNKNYNSIEESAMYEAGKSKTTYDLSLAYLQGSGQANRTVPEREMLDTKKWLNNANEDIIAAYEKGIRDTAFNNDVANQKIEEMLKNKN